MRFHSLSWLLIRHVICKEKEDVLCNNYIFCLHARCTLSTLSCEQFSGWRGGGWRGGGGGVTDCQRIKKQRKKSTLFIQKWQSKTGVWYSKNEECHFLTLLVSEGGAVKEEENETHEEHWIFSEQLRAKNKISKQIYLCSQFIDPCAVSEMWADYSFKCFVFKCEEQTCKHIRGRFLTFFHLKKKINNNSTLL